MKHLALASLVFAGSLLVSACGSDVETSGGSGGSGGTGTSTSDTSTTTTTATATGGGGGGGPVACGGLGGATCGADEYCDWADDSCGGDDGQGICQPRPDGACPPDCPGVCGCDGQFYCSTCSAAEAGVDVAANVSCTPGTDGYSAYFWAGGLDHIIIHKADAQANRCTQIYLAWPMTSPPEFPLVMPNGWGVQGAMITNNAADCAMPMSPPIGEVFNAASGTGSISWVVPPGMYAPCDLDVDVTLMFPGAPAWAPPSDTLTAMTVAVQGGCM